MNIFTSTPKAACGQCGESVTFRNDQAARLAARSGILCDACRQGPKRHTKMTYKEYLSTPEWKRFRQRAIKHYGRKCYLCAKKCNPDIHHNNRDRLGKEILSDVIPLCRSCHDIVTKYIG